MTRQILQSEYQDALANILENKNIVKKYLQQQKCECKNLTHKNDYNTFPYGESYSYDECVDCGKTFNFKII